MQSALATGARRVLAIDIGTSSCRAGLFDQDAQPVAPLSRCEYQPATPEAGASQFDASELVEAILACIDDALAK